ncbi:5,10-methylene-tetrahydrofolate dehydrogenase/5,10-methenyl-tetrahydrofolate cyclohydrolase [Umbelopsis sp. PMI_123]|nr:5,10-methylene-tetrahydrofolate dehydrogenase/5,10-methenyl-tetrahydrofolate cyclohydrolase [Umbelopsis sp. PMI_123]
MPAAVIDGKAISQSLRDQLKTDIAKLKEAEPTFQPKLALIQVGTRSDSSSYIRLKQKAAIEAGIEFGLVQFPETVTLDDLLKQIQLLNKDNSVHGVLAQLPLPEHIDEAVVIESISPKKDVDGLHPSNVGKLVARGNVPLIQPCTPKGIMALIRSTGVSIEGKHATVVGRGDLVGAPTSLLLTSANATVTLCHTKTVNIVDHIKRADILVVAIGQPNFVQGDWIKPGAIVIDVGMNYVSDSTKKSGYRTVGDVDYAAASQVAGHITPVPGGVGPMTVAMLMDNVFLVAKHSR